MMQTIDFKTFLNKVKKKIKEGIIYRDALLLCSVIEDEKMAALVSQADRKYQEATYTQTELSQQINVDECALASMGKLWQGEHFEGSTEQMISSEEETVLDTLYFILKYAKTENPLEASLIANDAVCGDKRARKEFLEMVFKV